jgi:16S rRNA G966 N2-methylase RsmD
LAVARRLPAGGFDLVFIDPPFDAGLHVPALDAVARLLAADALVYVESDTPMDEEAARIGLGLVRSLRAGQVHARLYQRPSATPSEFHLPAPTDH